MQAACEMEAPEAISIFPCRTRRLRTYPCDVVLNDSGNGFCVLDVFFGDHGQVGYLVSVIVDEIIERAFVILCDFI